MPDELLLMRRTCVNSVAEHFSSYQEYLEAYDTLGYFTCDSCDEVSKCEYAFDAYNTNGDCLADK
jgi:hypothetical protein